MIIKRKTYDALKNNNEFLVKANSELRKDNLKFQYAAQANEYAAKDANYLNAKLECDIDDLKRQVKNLKSLCTKHGVSYKSLYKEKKPKIYALKNVLEQNEEEK